MLEPQRDGVKRKLLNFPSCENPKFACLATFDKFKRSSDSLLRKALLLA